MVHFRFYRFLQKALSHSENLQRSINMIADKHEIKRISKRENNIVRKTKITIMKNRTMPNRSQEVK